MILHVSIAALKASPNQVLQRTAPAVAELGVVRHNPLMRLITNGRNFTTANGYTKFTHKRRGNLHADCITVHIPFLTVV